MNDLLLRQREIIIGRRYGPLAARGGVADARVGDPPYGASLSRRPDLRFGRLRYRWPDIGKLFLMTLAPAIFYQIVVFRWLHPMQSLLIAATISLPTYVIVRGLANRIARAIRRAERVRPGGGAS